MAERTSSLRGGEVLEALEAVIASRRAAPSSTSYTSTLLAAGPTAIGAKVTEEAAELVQAAVGEGDERVVSEASDLVYHVLVLLACRGLTLEAVGGELARRFGVSGLVEKASRRPTAPEATP